MPGFPIKVETLEGPTISFGNKRITPIAQAFTMGIRLPFYQNSAVWNRPVAVSVQSEDGTVERISVVDITRIVQLVLIGIAFVGILRFRRNSNV